MAKRKPPQKKEKGGKRMAQLGYRPVQIWLSPENYKMVFDVSVSLGRPVANYVKWTVVTHALMVLKTNKGAISD